LPRNEDIMRTVSLLLAVSALHIGTASVQAQDAASYPSRPVTIVLPFAAGGFSDKEARMYGTKLTGALGQPFVMDFRPGASGTIASGLVAKAKPDGYHTLIVTGSFTTFPALIKDLPFDIIKDFAPVSLMSQRTSVLIASPKFPVKNLAEYMAYAKANPGKINYGTVGVGGISHLAGAWMHNSTGSSVTFVNYKGAAPLMADLAAGRIDVTSTAALAAVPQVRAGKAVALAIMNARRSDLLPGVPTVSEQAIPNFDYSTWLGISTTGGTPAPIVNKLSQTLAKIAKDAEVVASLEAEGSTAVGSTPAQFRDMMAAETKRWLAVVRDTGIKLED
jgi:tripartite-type tricarboxylate transporter receptor subunit TctC